MKSSASRSAEAQQVIGLGVARLSWSEPWPKVSNVARKSSSEISSYDLAEGSATALRAGFDELSGRDAGASGSPLFRTATYTDIGLLVSVRNAGEARKAAAHGADVIDVKEPRRGPLGAADDLTMTLVTAAASTKPVTAALGELAELPLNEFRAPSGICALKAGLAACAKLDWQSMLAVLASRLKPSQELVAVAYADWQAAGAPHPEEIRDAACWLGLRWLLVDTWEKRNVCVLDLGQRGYLAKYVQDSRRAGLHIALAGGIPLDRIEEAGLLRPNLVAVRGAVCLGGREGSLSGALIAKAKRRVELATIGFARHDRGAQE